MPAFADTKTTTSSSDENRLEALFKADLQYRSESQSNAVVVAEGREGVYVGSGDGTATGDRLPGTVRWSLWSGNCLYPMVRSGQSVPEGLHLCTINPVGFIETLDGARIRFDGRGYGLRSSEKYQTKLTLIFSTEDARYEWLTKVVAVMDGDFDEKTRAGDLECLCPRWKPLMRLILELANEDNSLPENEPSLPPGCSLLKNQPNDFKIPRQ